MSKKEKKTNAMRILDTENVDYEILTYDWDEENIGGEHAAHEVGLPEEVVFKTLVTTGGGENIVCVIPVNAHLDLKKLAHSAGIKKLEMLHTKDLLKETGYIRGGCSPIGMKKKFRTFIDETCYLHDKIAVSGGMRGKQVFLSPDDLVRIVCAEVGDYTV